MQRRRVLGAFGSAALGSLSGCVGGAANLFETTQSREPPLVEDRPDAVYVPTHAEGMEMLPTGGAPDPLPGTSLGRGTSGDAAFVGSLVEADRFGDDPYLAVSARTPHNALTIPGMALTADVYGGEAYSGRLTPALDAELGFHYGASVAELAPDDEVAVTVDVPPQVARHEGYETAFLDMPSFELTE